MSNCEWTVDLAVGVYVLVSAETWWVNDNGDLLFGNVPGWTTQQGVTLHSHPMPSRGFAAGTWTEVSLYA